MDEAKKESESTAMRRRDFLTSAAMATTLAASGVVAVSFGWQFIYPASADAPTVTVLATSLARLPPGEHMVVNLAGNEVFLTNNNGTVRALSTVCTHLGCHAAWQDNRQHFLCPCHVGIFDANGMVLSGPPPRPLDEFPVEIKAGSVFVTVPQKEGVG